MVPAVEAARGSRCRMVNITVSAGDLRLLARSRRLVDDDISGRRVARCFAKKISAGLIATLASLSMLIAADRREGCNMINPCYRVLQKINFREGGRLNALGQSSPLN